MLSNNTLTKTKLAGKLFTAAHNYSYTGEQSVTNESWILFKNIYVGQTVEEIVEGMITSLPAAQLHLWGQGIQVSEF